MLEFLKNDNYKEAPDTQLISHTRLRNSAKQQSSAAAKQPVSKKLKCACCGTILRLPGHILKFKCAICQVTLTLPKDDRSSADNHNREKHSDKKASQLNLCNLQNIVKDCFKGDVNWDAITKEEKRKLLEPLTSYLRIGFHDQKILQNSFKSSVKHEIIDFDELGAFYDLLMKLPSRRPLYQMLCSCNELLKKPGELLHELNWIFIIFCNPMIRSCLTTTKAECFESSQMHAVSYELIKRCIGYLSNMTYGKKLDKLIHYLKYSRIEIFQSQVEILNLYITFHFLRITRRGEKNTDNLTILNLNQRDRIIPYGVPSADLSNENEKDVWNLRMGKIDSKDLKLKLFEYENDWHIRTAVLLMKIYHRSNEKRKNLLHLDFLGCEVFYNMMLDFLDYKQDFDTWKGVSNDQLEVFNDLYGPEIKKFNLCSFSFLLSLGVKIAIMEYEVRRIMEYEAEQAFLSSLDKGKTVAVYLRIKVRRAHITSDSLRCIKIHQKDLMKSLRVEFINEPGVDAGGLRKEWFLLLTKSLFNPMNGLFTYNEESRFSWPSINPIMMQDDEGHKGNDELYYLFGIVLGLAIFNSTILDLQFPKAFYKKLCGEPVTFNDYLELYPETGRNLLKMLNYEGDDFSDVFEMYFETTIEDYDVVASQPGVKKLTTVDLCSNGKNTKVTNENKQDFVNKWVNFHMNDSIRSQFDQFLRGFRQVFQDCESISFFNSEELEKLVCGSQESNGYDFKMLRSVTKYVGGFTDDNTVINWFWEIVANWDLQLQKKLLNFISGSDRVPPTGMSTLRFKISRLGNGKDSNKLPLAHTCFNELCMWEYSSKKKLEKKLWWAVTQSEGYAFK